MSAQAVVGIRPDAPRVVHVAAIAASSLACMVLYLFDPSDGGYPLCPFRAVTGLYCPGCGTLRCLHALLHLDLRSALDHNALTVLFVPMLVVAWLSVGFAGIRGRHPPLVGTAPHWAGWALGIGFGLFWILRNVPVEPFSWMAP